MAGSSGGIDRGDGGRSRLWEEEEKFVKERERLEGEEGESHGGCLVAAWRCWLLKAELEEEMMVALVSCSGGRKKKKQKKKICSGERKEGRLVFWLTLNPIFSSFRSSNPPLFIGSAREKSFLHWEKLSALNSVGKDPNRWLKEGIVHFQICSCRLPEVASLGWCHVRLFASEPVMTIPRRRGIPGD